MILACQFGLMKIFKQGQFLRGKTAHRVPKLITLAVTSSVLVAMVSLEASASPTYQAATRVVTNGISSNAGRSSGHFVGSFRKRRTEHSTAIVQPTTTIVQPTTTTVPAAIFAYPIGVATSSEPSGYAPPLANALAGYNRTYVTDFTGSALPAGWGSYEGQPGGDPGGQFDQAHVTVGNGMLQVNTWQDPAFNNKWVTGGACLCGITGQTYGAYFVRSRLTGPGPSEVELLIPDANVWPPELDFNESYGGSTNTSATVHFNPSNGSIERTLNIDITKWHTWGVIWTPTAITYTVDGNVWGTVTTASAIPSIPMHISLQSQTWCDSGWACPTTPQSLQVDWVAQYASN